MARSFGELLAKERRAKKITLRKLGQLVGLSPSFLSEMESGRRMPPKDEGKIRDLALVLNANENNLVEAARKERFMKSPAFFEKLFGENQDLAWGLYRAAEDASPDKLHKAIQDLLATLEENDE